MRRSNQQAKIEKLRNALADLLRVTEQVENDILPIIGFAAVAGRSYTVRSFRVEQEMARAVLAETTPIPESQEEKLPF